MSMPLNVNMQILLNKINSGWVNMSGRVMTEMYMED